MNTKIELFERVTVTGQGHQELTDVAVGFERPTGPWTLTYERKVDKAAISGERVLPNAPILEKITDHVHTGQDGRTSYIASISYRGNEDRAVRWIIKGPHGQHYVSDLMSYDTWKKKNPGSSATSCNLSVPCDEHGTIPENRGSLIWGRWLKTESKGNPPSTNPAPLQLVTSGV